MPQHQVQNQHGATNETGENQQATNTTEGTSNTAQTAEAERTRLRRAIPPRWLTLGGSLFSTNESAAEPPSAARFKAGAYRLIADHNDDVNPMLALLATSSDREAYRTHLAGVKGTYDLDVPKAQLVKGDLEDLIGGGDVAFNTQRIVAHFSQISREGKKWFKESPQAGEWIVNAFRAYVNGGGARAHGMAGASMFRMAEMGERRENALAPVLRLIRTGRLGAAPEGEEEQQEGPTEEQQADWQRQANELKSQIETYLPAEPDADASLTEQRAARTREPNRMTLARQRELLDLIREAPAEVRDIIHGDTALMQRLMNAGSAQQVATIMRALDSVQALYEECRSSRSGVRRRDENGELLPRPAPPLQLIKDYLLNRRDDAAARARVLQHTRLKDDFIDSLSEENNRLIYRIVARGTDQPSPEDQIHAAVNSGDAATAARALMRLAESDPTRLAALQDDQIFRNSIRQLNDEVEVDGIMVRPYHLVLQMWGQRPGATTDPGADERQTQENPEGEDARPITVEERNRLNTELYNRALTPLVSELDDWHVDDSTVVGAVRGFAQRAAREPYKGWLRREGNPPGPTLEERYNSRTGRSIRNDIAEGVDDEGRQECERVLGMRIDAATVGTLGGRAARANDGTEAAEGHVSLEQALRENRWGRRTVSQVLHDNANTLKAELAEGFFSGYPDIDDTQTVYTQLHNMWESCKDAVENATGQVGQLFWEELFMNAYQEKDGPLGTKLDAAFDGGERTRARRWFGLGPGQDRQRRNAAQESRDAADPEGALQRNALAQFGGPAQELFAALGALNSRSQDPAIQEAGRLLSDNKSRTIEAPTSTATSPQGGNQAGPRISAQANEPTASSFAGYYRIHNGIDPMEHASRVARALGAQRQGGPRPRHTPAEIAGLLGVPAESVEGAIEAPSESAEINEANRRLVRPGFTVDTARGNAAEMWRILHGRGQLHVINAILYGPYNDEEQRLIRVEFRKLSGGIDFHFYIRQAQQAQERSRERGGSGNFAYNASTVGGEGTAAGNEIASGRVMLDADATELETAMSIATTGVIDQRTRLSTAIGNGDMDQLFRIVDELDDGGCRQVLEDTAIMARLRAFCSDEVAWDRVYKTLTGQSDLYDRLRSRSEGYYGAFRIFDATDEEGMRNDIRDYITRLRREADREVRAEARADETLSADPQAMARHITTQVNRRVREACRALNANPDVAAIVDSELSGYEQSQTEGMIFGQGSENADAHLLRDGDWSENETDIINAIRGMSLEERRRRRSDPEFLRRLGDLVDTEDDYRDAMNALMSDAADTSGGGGAAGQDHLTALDEASRGPHEVSGDMNRDEDAIIQNLSELTEAEYRRLLENPRLMAQVLAGLDNDPTERALARQMLAFRFEDAAAELDTVGALDRAASANPVSDAEMQRLAYAKFNAVARIRGASTMGWDEMLAQVVEVYKLNLRPAGGAPPPTTGPSAVSASDANAEPSEETTEGQGAAQQPQLDPAQVDTEMRTAIWNEVRSSIGTFTRREGGHDDLAGSTMRGIIQDGIMHRQDPSTTRLRENIGAWDDSDGVMSTLRGASDDTLIQEWTSIIRLKQNGSRSFRSVYRAFRGYREQMAAQANNEAASEGATEGGVSETQDGDTAINETASDGSSQETQGANPNSTATNENDEQTTQQTQEVVDPELERRRFEFLNYVVDLSGNIEDILLPHAGGAFSEGGSTAFTRDENQVQTSVRDNNEWHEWMDLIRDRIPNLPAAKIGEAIGATDVAADMQLIDNPNRQALTQQNFRTHRYLRSRGEGAGNNRIAQSESEALDQAMVRYGRNIGEVQTNEEGGYGEITEDEQRENEQVYGAEVDRALTEFKSAREAIANWAALIVGVLITAVITILTAGVATGPAAMIMMGALTAAASATGQALTREAIMGNDYDFSRDGLESIAQAAITGMITAGTTYYAQALMRGVAGMSSAAQQVNAAGQVIRTPPPMWQSLLTEAGEEVITEGMSGTIEAGLSALDPTHWMHGWTSGSRRASQSVRARLSEIPNAALQSAITSLACGVTGRVLGDGGDDAIDDLANHGRRNVDVRANFAEYFGDQAGTMQEAFVSWAVEQGFRGEFPDIESVPAHLVRAYLEEVQEKGNEMHTNTANAGRRRRRMDADVDANGGNMTQAERHAFAEMNARAEGTTPYVTVEQFVAVREGMANDAIANFEGDQGVTLNEAQRFAFIEFCRQANNPDAFRARLQQNPLSVPSVIAAGQIGETETTTETPTPTPPAPPTTTVTETSTESTTDAVDTATETTEETTDSSQTATDVAAEVVPTVTPTEVPTPGTTDTTVETEVETTTEQEVEEEPPSVTEEQNTETAIDGASHAIDPNYQGDARETADPAAVKAHIAPAIAQIQGMFPNAEIKKVTAQSVTFVAGDQTFTVRIRVSRTQRQDGDLPPVATFNKTGDDTYSITLSNRARNKHVERALAHEMAEIIAIEQAAKEGRTLSQEDALAEGSTATELSAHDIGRIAELRVLLRQANEVRTVEGRNPNPVEVEQLTRDIEQLMEHLGLVGEGPDVKQRFDMIASQLNDVEARRFMIADDASRRKAIRAQLGRHSGVEVHSHFMGVAEVDVFLDAMGSWQAVLEAIASITERNRDEDEDSETHGHGRDRHNKSRDKFQHQTEDGQITKRSDSGDAIRIAQEARAFVQDLRDALADKLADETLSEAERARLTEQYTASMEEVAKEACRIALVTTEQTDFNSSYEVRDELVKDFFDPAGDKSNVGDVVDGRTVTPEDVTASQNRGYEAYAEATIARLLEDGIRYNEQSNSIKKLQQRFPPEMVQRVMRKMKAEGRLDMRWVALMHTGNLAPTRNDDGELSREGDFQEAQDNLDDLQDREDVMGPDIAGMETFRFTEGGKERFKELYRRRLALAEKHGRSVVLRPHVGEGSVDMDDGKPYDKHDPSRREDGEPTHYDRARNNLDKLLEALEELGEELDPSKVDIRFGHATHATPEQATRMKALKIIAEVNLGSNIETGVIDQTREREGADGETERVPVSQEKFDDHSLLSLIFTGVQTILSTDAHSVMSTNLGDEYSRAYALIEQFLAGQRTVKVHVSQISPERAAGRAVDEHGSIELSRDDLTSAELQRFLDGYEQLHKWALEWEQRVRAGDRTDKRRIHDTTAIEGSELDTPPRAEATPGQQTLETAMGAFTGLDEIFPGAQIQVLGSSGDVLHVQVTTDQNQVIVEVRAFDPGPGARTVPARSRIADDLATIDVSQRATAEALQRAIADRMAEIVETMLRQEETIGGASGQHDGPRADMSMAGAGMHAQAEVLARRLERAVAAEDTEQIKHINQELRLLLDQCRADAPHDYEQIATMLATHDIPVHGIHVEGQEIGTEHDDAEAAASARWQSHLLVDAAEQGNKFARRLLDNPVFMAGYIEWMGQAVKVKFEDGKAIAVLEGAAAKKAGAAIQGFVDSRGTGIDLYEGAWLGTRSLHEVMRKAAESDQNVQLDPTAEDYQATRGALIEAIRAALTQMGHADIDPETLLVRYEQARAAGITADGKKEHADQRDHLLKLVPQTEIDRISSLFPGCEVYVTGSAVQPKKDHRATIDDIDIMVVAPDGTTEEQMEILERQATTIQLELDPEFLEEHGLPPDHRIALDAKVMPPDQFFGFATRTSRTVDRKTGERADRTPLNYHRLDEPESAKKRNRDSED
jgi:hypothetical protein